MWAWRASALAALVAASIGYAIVHVPFDVSDNVSTLITIDGTTVERLFTSTGTMAGFMRPAGWFTAKLVADASGGDYFAGFKAFNIITVLLLMLGGVRLLHVRSSLGFGVAALTLAVMMGIHTFHDSLRETPLNGHVFVPLWLVGAVLLADSRPRRWKDVVVLALAIYAMLFVELGLLLPVCLVVGYAVGLRGISRGAVIASCGLVGVYLYARFFYLHVGAPGFVERSSGFGLGTLDPPELAAKFGGNALPFYAYNVVASAMDILFSEPRAGVFVFVRELVAGALTSGTMLNVVTSLATTGVIAWFAAVRWRAWLAGDFEHADQIILIAGAVIAANAFISFSYTKDVTVNTGAVFYALAAGIAVQSLMIRVAGRRLPVLGTAALVVLLMVISVGWTVRAATFYLDMRASAYAHQNNWVMVYEWLERERIPLRDDRERDLVRRLRAQMLAMTTPRGYLGPAWLGDLDPH